MTLLLLVMALGNLNYNDSLTTGNSFRDDVDSVEGQELIDQSFPGGANAPTEVVVENPVGRTELVAAITPAQQGWRVPVVERRQPLALILLRRWRRRPRSRGGPPGPRSSLCT